MSVRGGVIEVAAAPEGAAQRSRWLLLGLLTASYGGGAFGVLGVSPLSPYLLDGFHLTRFTVGLLLPAVYGSGLLFSLAAGRAADRWGARVTLLVGLALAAASMGVASSAPTYALLLACLFAAGTGWSIANPALGKAIIDIFPARERGVAMGIKQMGLTMGGVASALALPSIAARWGLRAALIVCALVAIGPLLASWPRLALLPRPVRHAAVRRAADTWWWARRPALLVYLAGGVGMGMQQAALLGYLPLYGKQVLGMTAVAAGGMLAAAQFGGAVARVVLGLASDRTFRGRRTPWLVTTNLLSAGLFLWYAHPVSVTTTASAVAAFFAGMGSFGWVGLYLVLAAEVGGREQAGLMTGVAMAAILSGLLVGPPIFGGVLQALDSFTATWLLFATMSVIVATAYVLVGPAVQRERRAASDAVDGPAARR